MTQAEEKEDGYKAALTFGAKVLSKLQYELNRLANHATKYGHSKAVCFYVPQATMKPLHVIHCAVDAFALAIDMSSKVGQEIGELREEGKAQYALGLEAGKASAKSITKPGLPATPEVNQARNLKPWPKVGQAWIGWERRQGKKGHELAQRIDYVQAVHPKDEYDEIRVTVKDGKRMKTMLANSLRDDYRCVGMEDLKALNAGDLVKTVFEALRHLKPKEPGVHNYLTAAEIEECTK